VNTQLRAAGPADATRVADILIEARAAFMPYAPSVHPDNDVRTWVREQLLPAGGATVAVVSGRVVGIMSVSQESAHSWITQMSVEPRFVGQRIGSALLAHAMGVLPRPLRLYTFQANTGARRFYERHGFVPIAFTDGAANEERCPDVLYELPATARAAG
jgi:GNAT superfamily N-acetyltransferase